MNYYHHHIGDYDSATSHLTWDEDLAYRRLLSLYYRLERGLPDHVQCCRLIRAITPEHKQAVMTILGEFFECVDEVFTNERCDEEIGKFHHTCEINKRIAQNREAKKRDVRARTVHESSTERSPPTTQEPITNSSSLGISARDLEAKLREAAGWQNEPHPNLFVTGPIEALIASGAYLETDILPIISSRCRSAKPVGWNYFVGPIRDAMEARVNASKPLNLNGNTANGHPQRNSRAHNFAILDAVIAEAQRREDGEGSGDGETVVIGPA